MGYPTLTKTLLPSLGTNLLRSLFKSITFLGGSNMRMKLIIGGLLSSVALYPAIAQQSPAPAPAPSAPAQRMEPASPAQRTPMATPGQWRASKLVGVDIYNTANE